MSAMPLTTLFLDMNAFFASCEQQLRPELRGRPTIVVPVTADTTCCIAASYEAKPYGIQTGTAVGRAKRLCPGLCVIEARPELYITIHQQIVEAVESCLPVAAICSIDEMYCRLMGEERLPGRGIEIGRQIKQAIASGVGEYLTCSVGVGPNRFLAKVAAEMQKPDGLVVIEPHELPEKLYRLELSDLPGIGRQMLARLTRCGISSVRQLCELSRHQLRTIWGGVVGEEFWHLLRGHDLEEPLIHRRSVGHSHVLPPEFRTDEGSRAVLVRLIHKAATRLRYINYWARRFHVFMSFIGGGSWEADASLGYCQDTITMLQTFARLWEARPRGKTPLKVGITLTGLIENRYAPAPLFLEEEKRLRLVRAADRLNRRYGSHVVYFGGMHIARQTAPRRIAFLSVPDLALPA